MILHITTDCAWQNALRVGEYTATSLSKEGFIHCSEPHQVIKVADFIFKHQKGLKLLVIDTNKVKSCIRYESGGGNELFPHIYGPINLDSVIEVLNLTEGADGFVLPDRLRTTNN